MDTLITGELALFFARVILGYTMFHFGLGKMMDIQKAKANFSDMGFKPAGLWAFLMTTTELVGGLAVILGIYPEVGALFIAYAMIVGTTYKISSGKGFGQWSYDLLIFALCAVGLTLGFGPYTVIHTSLMPDITFKLLALGITLGILNGIIPPKLSKK